MERMNEPVTRTQTAVGPQTGTTRQCFGFLATLKSFCEHGLGSRGYQRVPRPLYALCLGLSSLPKAGQLSSGVFGRFSNDCGFRPTGDNSGTEFVSGIGIGRRVPQ